MSDNIQQPATKEQISHAANDLQKSAKEFMSNDDSALQGWQRELSSIQKYDHQSQRDIFAQMQSSNTADKHLVDFKIVDGKNGTEVDVMPNPDQLDKRGDRQIISKIDAHGSVDTMAFDSASGGQQLSTLGDYQPAKEPAKPSASDSSPPSPKYGNQNHSIDHELSVPRDPRSLASAEYQNPVRAH